jgi:hypothetical protein
MNYRSIFFALVGTLATATAFAVTCEPNMSPRNPDSSYSVGTDGTVTHIPTNLVWKRCSEGQNWNGSTCIGEATYVSWAEALTISSNSRFAGKSDWRLPNLKELRSLVEECRVEPSINDTLFPATPYEQYKSIFWSSSPNDGWISDSWGVEFGTGTSYDHSRSSSYAVRLVRLENSFDSLGAINPPICDLSASLTSVTVGGTSTLTANCSPAPTSYRWTGGSCVGTTASTCTVTPSVPTTYTVVGINAGGTGNAASIALSVTPCIGSLIPNILTLTDAGASTGQLTVISACAWTATSNSDWISLSSTTSGTGSSTLTFTVAANTSSASRSGTLTVAGQTFTVTQAGANVAAPVCTLSASPSSIPAGASSELTASCAGATSYTWTGGSCAGTTAATCKVTPSATTIYSVAGSNAGGKGNPASATVTVTASTATPATMTSPAQGSTLAGSTATFTWNAGSGVSEYWLSISTKILTNTADVYGRSQGTNQSAKVVGLPTNGQTLYVKLFSLIGGAWTSNSYTYTAASPKGAVPQCALAVVPPVTVAGSKVSLTATCFPEATSYVWFNNDIATVDRSATDSPTGTKLYSIVGVNAAGTSAPANAAVYVCNTPPAANYTGLTLTGTSANEQLVSGISNDTIDGGPGFDTVIYQCNKDSFTVTKTANGWTVSSKAEGIDTLTNVERIKFGNETLALDISGVAGQAYRIYQAAFNRVPDNGGLKYWISQMDAGMSQLEVAARFVDSDEFRALYGANPTNAEFLTRLYSNVLHRTPDPGGYAWWLGELDAGRYNKVTALAGFSESPENQAGVLNAIINGIDLLN